MSQNEQAFLAYCNEMIRLAAPLFAEEMEKTGLEDFELGHGIDFPGSPHPVGSAWLREPYSIYAKVHNPKSGGEETVQITICATSGWKPILSVSSSKLDPVTFQSSNSPQDDLAAIRKILLQCFARMVER